MMAKEEIQIRNRAELKTAVQDFLALKTLAKLIEVEAAQVEAALKQAKEQFGLGTGPATEFDGPNGGITYAERTERSFDPAAIQRYMGDEVYNMTTEVTVRTGAIREWLRAQIMERCAGKQLTKKQAAEIMTEQPPKTVINAAFNRRAVGTKPLIPLPIPTERDNRYQPRSREVFAEFTTTKK